MKDIEIKELDGGVGAEIHGVDIKKLSNSQFSSIRAVSYTHLTLPTICRE